MLKVLLCCLLAGLTSATELSLTMDISETPLHTGADVTMVCRVTHRDDEIILWIKSVADLTGISPFSSMTEEEFETNELMEQIAMNDMTILHYGINERYSASMSSVGDVTLFMLNIKNVTDAETGYYTCVVVNDKSHIATRMLEVYEVPDDVHFESATGNITNITLTQGEGLDLSCHVHNTVPAPMIRLSVGHESGDFRDVTNQFKKEIAVNYHCEEAASLNKLCPLNMDFDVSMVGKYVPSYMDNKQFLKCEASYPEYMDLPKVSTRLMVLYEYVPKFQCGSEWKVLETATRAVVMCHGLSDPAPLNAVWEFNIAGKKYELPVNGTDGDFKAKYSSLDPGFAPVEGTDYELTIDNLKPEHLTSYTLKVTNPIGTNSTKITLKKESTNPDPNDAVSSRMVSPLVLVFAAILAFFKC